MMPSCILALLARRVRERTLLLLAGALLSTAAAPAGERVCETPDSLFVETAFVDKAPNKHMRRWRPRAMGRATRIQKGLSHITIHLGARE